MYNVDSLVKFILNSQAEQNFPYVILQEIKRNNI